MKYKLTDQCLHNAAQERSETPQLTKSIFKSAHNALQLRSSMSQSQNDARLDDLATKVSALRGVTIDIHGQANDQSYIDANVRSCLTSSLLDT